MPRFGTWNVVKVVRGTEKVVANLGTVPVESGTTIRVDLEGGRLRFSVNGRLAARTVNDSTFLSAAHAGMSIRTGTDVRQARWDDFRAASRSPGPTP